MAPFESAYNHLSSLTGKVGGDGAAAIVCAATCLAVSLYDKHSASKKAQEAAKSAEAEKLAMAQGYICSLSGRLMANPVTAEDGILYEEFFITSWFQENGGVSPMTGEVIGLKLLPANRIHRTIESLVENRTIDGALAEKYRILQTVKKADKGDAKAMEELAGWYKTGTNGFPKDEPTAERWKATADNAKFFLTEAKEKAGDDIGSSEYNRGVLRSQGLFRGTVDMNEAYSCFQKSAKLNDPSGIALVGLFVRHGLGSAEMDTDLAKHLTNKAALLGSDYACYQLGKWFMKGEVGCPKDAALAKLWLTKCSDGSCKHKHLNKSSIDRAKKWLLEIDG